MTAKPTAVLVRLPLSDNEKMALTSGVKMGGSIEQGLLAIGAPVAGGDLEVVNYSDYEPEYHDQGMGCGLEDRGITDRYDAMGYGWDQALERVFSELPETVLLSDAQAALAAAQAEHKRITEENRQAFCEALEKIIRKAHFLSQHPIIDEETLVFLLTGKEALKGPEA